MTIDNETDNDTIDTYKGMKFRDSPNRRSKEIPVACLWLLHSLIVLNSFTQAFIYLIFSEIYLQIHSGKCKFCCVNNSFLQRL